ncbi:MAG: carbonic anhydrase [Bdellovibrionia bacterium]
MLIKRYGRLFVAALGIALSCVASGTEAPKTALHNLKSGNQRFVSGKASHCQVSDEKIAAHKKAQTPDAVILSCSDSRVPPERIFDQDIGELFTIRVAGNVLSEDVVASIEYAVQSLGARLVVVMGHGSCGAIKAAVSKKTDREAGSPNLNHLIEEIRNNLVTQGDRAGQGGATSSDTTYTDAAKKNVSAVAADLMKRSKIVRDAVQAGKLQIAQAMYDLGSGQVKFAE